MARRKPSSTLLGLICLVSLRVWGQATPGPSQQELNLAASNSTDWLMTNHDYEGRRFVDLADINSSNVGSMQPICMRQMPELAPTETNPLVYRGVMYISSTHFTTALSATDCHLKWMHHWIKKGPEPYHSQRGVAIKDGLVIRGTVDGYLLALNADNGELKWSRKIADSYQGQFISMPPLIYDDLVIIGAAGSEMAAKGWIGGFRLSDGERVWKFNTVPDMGEPGSETWSNPEALAHGGGGVWTPLSLDVDRGLVYVPVGNPAPDYYDDQRQGANLYTGSLLALNARTGKLSWYYHAVPHDIHDWDLTQVSPLFHSSIAGVDREIVTVVGKDGLVRLLDRNSHSVLREVEFSARTNIDIPISQGVRFCPGPLGGVQWNGPAYNPRTNLLYVPSSEWCAYLKKSEAAPIPGMDYYTGAEGSMDPWDKARGSLTAIDPSTGKIRWRYQSEKPMVAAVTTTSGGLVFTGEIAGNFLAMDANSGKVLYRFATGGPLPGGIVTYAIGGRQYVGAMTGFVSGFFALEARTELGGGSPTLVLFALPESPNH